MRFEKPVFRFKGKKNEKLKKSFFVFFRGKNLLLLGLLGGKGNNWGRKIVERKKKEIVGKEEKKIVERKKVEVEVK
jgi:hypothetical protein